LYLLNGFGFESLIVLALWLLFKEAFLDTLHLIFIEKIFKGRLDKRDIGMLLVLPQISFQGISQLWVFVTRFLFYDW
jgi:hypothetical protein